VHLLGSKYRLKNKLSPKKMISTKMNAMNLKQLEIKNSISNDDDDEDGDNKFSSKKNVDKSSKTPVLDTFSRDLTKNAQEGRIDPIIGREKEIQRVSQILSRRKKNNPILIGEPGCVDRNTLITVRKISDDYGHEIINI
jgi:ATP-dependent Clp protease ATP-binding subunit ClpC